jgi:hypothetical protein
MTKIKITAHHSGFYVIRDTGGDRAPILAEHRRYEDALAAARLMARDMGLDVEVQPAGLEGGAG